MAEEFVKVVGWDVETFRLAPGVAAPTLVCLSFDDGEKTGLVLDEEAVELFVSWLDDPSVVLVAHNASSFDNLVMAVECQERRWKNILKKIFVAIADGRLRCTKIRDKILENARGELKYDWDEDLGQYRAASFTLERCCWNRLNEFVKKSIDTWRLRYGLLYRIPIDRWAPEAIEYAIKDSSLARRLFFAQEDAFFAEDGDPRPDGLANIPGEIATTRGGFALALMAAWGVRTDPEITAVVKKDFQERYDAAAATAAKCDLVGTKKVTEIRPEYADRYDNSKEGLKAAPPEAKHRVIRPKRNMKKIQDRIRFIYTSRGQDVPMVIDKKTKQPTKNISTDRETLTFKRFPTWEKDKALQAVADVVRYEKLLKTYVPILERGNRVPITASWNEMVETFRTSCSKPNLQNLPRGSAKHGDDLVRRCFVPRPGWTFAFCDYDTLEMRTLAQRMIDLGFSRALAEAFKAGLDPHVIMTAEMLGISYEECERRYKAGEKLVDDARQGNKITNYGCGGGMGVEALRDYARGYDQEISIELSRQLHGNYRRTWGTDDYFSYVSALMGEGGQCETFVDPRTGYVRGQIRYTALCNWGFQHPAAVGAKAALVAVSEECYAVEDSPLFGCRPWEFGHDEIGMEVPYVGARASEAAGRLREVMVEQMSVLCPDVPIGATAVLCRRWYKGARPVRVDGILVPSKPEKTPDGRTVWVHDEGEERRAAA